MKILYDIAYIINLDRSLERWNSISESFDKLKLPYQRFGAIDGYNVNLTDITTNINFSGMDLANNSSLLDPSKVYRINCNENLQFHYYPITVKTAGEIGVWCSHMLIWHDIVLNGYENALIFEDDVTVKASNITKKINKFIIDLPETYDIAYLSVHQIQGYKIPLTHAHHISKFSDNALWDGAHALLISNKGAKKLISDNMYFLALDYYIYNVVKKIIPRNFELEIYRSSDNLFAAGTDATSEITKMGRITSQKYHKVNDEDIALKFGYDEVYFINLERSKSRREKITKHLDSLGISYTLFNAIDGYTAKITDINSNQTFTGLDIKNQKFNMEVGKFYQITCDPTTPIPTILEYYAAKTLVAGEVGVLCSYNIIWRNIILNSYHNTVVLEDDFVSKTDDFAFKLHKFIADLPSNYDIAYLDVRQYKGSKLPIEGKEHISIFTNGSMWNGLWASVFSLHGAAKLYSIKPYFAPVDVCITGISDSLNSYVSSIKLAGHEGPSDICAMGLGPEETLCLS
jgi:GR25 family glycosyltransferase involved in LPS biosynthesis